MSEARIFYQEDCNSLLDGKDNRNHRLWQPGTCTCIKLKGVRMQRHYRLFMREASSEESRRAGI